MDGCKVLVLDREGHVMRDGWTLEFQRARWNYNSGFVQEGYRFIYKRPNGSLQPAMGQARGPNTEIMQKLIARACEKGWGHFDADNPTYKF